MNNKTFRIFSIVLYDDSSNLCFDNILQKSIKNNFVYFYIKHNKESDDLKDHIHFTIYFEKPTTISYISKSLDIPQNYINVLDESKKRYTLKKTIGYLIHYNNNDKIQYNKSDIITNREDIVNKYYDILTGGNNEKNELKEIIAFITDNNANLTDVLNFCIECDYLKTLKKYSYILCNISRYHYYM